MDSKAYRVFGPLLRALPPEAAHRIAVRALAAHLLPASEPVSDDSLRTQVCGLRFDNPIGLAAGFDKNGEAVGPLLRAGFGFVEVGTVTPRPQSGNPRPRVFRLRRERAVINRLGFNSEGMGAVAERLSAFRQEGAPAGALGVNVGANRDSIDPARDYAEAAEALGPLADYVAVNVSSPNTPGLRDLQAGDPLARVLAGVVEAVARAADQRGRRAPPVLAKIAPDLSGGEVAEIVASARRAGADGLIATNTTTARPAGLRGRHRRERGGLSGPPLFGPATRALASAYRESGGALPVIGVGGVDGPDTAYAKIRAGASLVQLYTGLVYEGPHLAGDIARGLARRLRADGFAHVSDAVGADHR